MYSQYFRGSQVPTFFVFFPSQWQIVLSRFLKAQSKNFFLPELGPRHFRTEVSQLRHSTEIGS